MRLGIVIKGNWGFFEEIYTELAANHQTSIFNPQVKFPPFLKNRVENYLSRRKMYQFMQKNDVVFFEWAREPLVIASNLPKHCGIITRLHRYELYQWADKINWDNVDKIILVSHAKREEFIRRFSKQASKIEVIPEAVSLERFHPKPKTYSGDIGILGNIIPRKRVYELILAYYELLQQNSSFHLHIGGGPLPAELDYFEAVHDLVKKLNLELKVTFYDHVDNPEDWYSMIDIYISNGFSEGLQVSSLEAMASGCFCLSHFWAGAEELLPKENLFSTNSEMINLMKQYSETSEAEKKVHKERMRQIVCDNFNLENIKVRIRKEVEEVNKSLKQMATP